MWLVLCALLLQLFQSRDPDGYSPTDRERITQFRRELYETGLPAWAARYAPSAYSDFYLVPKAGFVHVLPSCMGPIVCFASLRADGDRLELTFEGREDRPVTYWSVPWGPRRYLIPEFLIWEFCAAVNAGDEPSKWDEGLWWMRAGDLGRPAPGKPQLPEPWPSLLLDAPIETRILRIERNTFQPVSLPYERTEIRVLLHAGTRHGVRKDMGFFLGREGRMLARVKLIDETACWAVVREGDDHRGRYLKVGDYAGTTRPR